jgi:hypothetical protein
LRLFLLSSTYLQQLIFNRRYALLPFALFCRALAPVPVGVLNLLTGAAISQSNCSATVPGSLCVPPRARSHPNSAIFLQKPNLF